MTIIILNNSEILNKEHDSILPGKPQDFCLNDQRSHIEH